MADQQKGKDFDQGSSEKQQEDKDSYKDQILPKIEPIIALVTEKLENQLLSTSEVPIIPKNINTSKTEISASEKKIATLEFHADDPQYILTPENAHLSPEDVQFIANKQKGKDSDQISSQKQQEQKDSQKDKILPKMETISAPITLKIENKSPEDVKLIADQQKGKDYEKQEKINSLEINRQRSECVSLNNFVQKLSHSGTSVQEKYIKELNQKNEESQLQIKELHKQVEALKSDQIKSLKIHEEDEQLLSEKQDKINSLYNQLENNHTSQVSEHEKLFKELNQKNEESQQQINELHKQIEGQKSDKSEYQKILFEKEQKIQKLQEKSQEDQKNFQDQISEKQEKINSLNNQLQLSQSITSEQEKLFKVSNLKNEESQHQIRELQKQVEALESDQGRPEKQKGQKDSQKDNSVKIENKSSEVLEAEVSSLRMNLEKVHAKIHQSEEKYHKQQKELLTKIRILKDENQVLQDFKANASVPTQNYNTNHESNQENYKKIIADQQAKNNELQATFKQLKEIIDERDNFTKEMCLEMHNDKDKIHQNNMLISDLQNQNTELKLQLEKYQQEQNITQLNDTINQLHNYNLRKEIEEIPTQTQNLQVNDKDKIISTQAQNPYVNDKDQIITTQVQNPQVNDKDKISQIIKFMINKLLKAGQEKETVIEDGKQNEDIDPLSNNGDVVNQTQHKLPIEYTVPQPTQPLALTEPQPNIDPFSKNGDVVYQAQPKQPIEQTEPQPAQPLAQTEPQPTQCDYKLEKQQLMIKDLNDQLQCLQEEFEDLGNKLQEFQDSEQKLKKQIQMMDIEFEKQITINQQNLKELQALKQIESNEKNKKKDLNDQRKPRMVASKVQEQEHKDMVKQKSPPKIMVSPTRIMVSPSRQLNFLGYEVVSPNLTPSKASKNKVVKFPLTNMTIILLVSKLCTAVKSQYFSIENNIINLARKTHGQFNMSEKIMRVSFSAIKIITNRIIIIAPILTKVFSDFEDQSDGMRLGFHLRNNLILIHGDSKNNKRVIFKQLVDFFFDKIFYKYLSLRLEYIEVLRGKDGDLQVIQKWESAHQGEGEELRSAQQELNLLMQKKSQKQAGQRKIRRLTAFFKDSKSSFSVITSSILIDCESLEKNYITIFGTPQFDSYNLFTDQTTRRLMISTILQSPNKYEEALKTLSLVRSIKNIIQMDSL